MTRRIDDEDNFVDVPCEYIYQTEKAVQVNVDENAVTLWIPKSVTSQDGSFYADLDDTDKGVNITLQVKEWFYKKDII